MSDINWSQKREVFRSSETGEIYVKVGTGFILVEDYVEGGRVEDGIEDLELIGVFTNAQIDAGEYLPGGDLHPNETGWTGR